MYNKKIKISITCYKCYNYNKRILGGIFWVKACILRVD